MKRAPRRASAFADLERALGKKTMEVEILQAARDEVKKRPRFYGVSRSGDGAEDGPDL